MIRARSTVGSDASLQCQTGLGHGDANGRGNADYVSASSTTGAAFWSALYPDLYSAVDGSSLGNKSGPDNFLIYWDADESRELEDATSITKFGGGTPLSCSDCASNNGTKATPTLTADPLGDWREEVAWRQSDNKALRIYTTTVTKRRLYTLMHGPPTAPRCRSSSQRTTSRRAPGFTSARGWRIRRCRIDGSCDGKGGCRCAESFVGATLKAMTHVMRVQQIVEEVRQFPVHERMDVLRGLIGLMEPAISAEQENGIAEALDEAERGETVDGVPALAAARKRGSVLPGVR